MARERKAGSEQLIREFNVAVCPKEQPTPYSVRAMTMEVRDFLRFKKNIFFLSVPILNLRNVNCVISSSTTSCRVNRLRTWIKFPLNCHWWLHINRTLEMLCTPKSNDLFLRRITTTTTRIMLSCGVLFHMILMEILLLSHIIWGKFLKKKLEFT